jgi:hypothetical protein
MASSRRRTITGACSSRAREARPRVSRAPGEAAIAAIVALGILSVRIGPWPGLRLDEAVQAS